MRPAAGVLAFAIALLMVSAAVPASDPKATVVAPKAASSKKKTPTKKAATKSKPKQPSPAVTAKQRAQATDAVNSWVEAVKPIENPAALVPFLLRLSQFENGQSTGLLRVLHFGDSHTAADEWTGMIRHLLQSRFGDGGTGFLLPGRPFLGFRRLDTKSTATSGWTTEGLAQATGDGLFGLGGTCISTRRAGESLSLAASGSRFELFYLKQPEGGRLSVSVDGVSQPLIETDGEWGPGYFKVEVEEGLHTLALRTLDAAPVRLFGWVAENRSGVTYESLGINGAQASLILNWNEELYDEHLKQRDPALIVLAYGTNEAGAKDWTEESYGAMFSDLIARLRKASPTASILVIGPPDRYIRSQGRMTVMDRVDMIVAAQRKAALSGGCAFWDIREGMGGKGSMRQWVAAGLAQPDYVHFTQDGYRLLGGALYEELIRDLQFFQQSYAGAQTPAAAGANR
jgi:lysophospholipase L1-like esterase